MLSPGLAQRLERALRGLRHGSVQLVVHDAQVVRIERIERLRLPAALPREAAGATQTGLTVSPEASPVNVGQPTESSEGRHGEHEEA